jgi:hypothetical protein
MDRVTDNGIICQGKKKEKREGKEEPPLKLWEN